MGATSEGTKAGKKASQKQDIKAGRRTYPNVNKFKMGTNDSVTRGATAGVVSEATQGAKAGAEEATKNRKNNRIKKKIGNIFQNIKGAIKGNIKDIFVLSVKMTLYTSLAVLIFLALVVEGGSEFESEVAKEVIKRQYGITITGNAFGSSDSSSSSGSSGSSSEGGTGEAEGVVGENIAANTYAATGSLIYATNEEITAMANTYFAQIKDKNENYHDIFSAKYFGKDSSTVASRIKHITTNYETSETVELTEVTNKSNILEGAATPKTERTMFEHVLRAEKYNFNNVIYRNFIGGKQSGTVPLTVDLTTELQYPQSDPNATNNADLTLDYFVTKTRPYLQTWFIPFDLMVGTQDDQDDQNLNGQFAYSIITNAYHEIVHDRYEIENLQRTTDYLVYNKTTTTTTTTRTCKDYERVVKEGGSPCDDKDYAKGLCIYHQGVTKCSDTDVKNNHCNCSRVGENVLCAGQGGKASWGIIAKDVKEKTTYCVDTEKQDVKEEKDVREAVVSNEDETDTLTYSWTYVISLAKTLDRVISNEYTFEEYFEYSLENFLKFINKKDDYKSMTAEQYQESEKTNSKADAMTTESKDYNTDDTTTDDSNFDWNKSKVVEDWSSVPSDAGTVVQKSDKSQVVRTVTNIKKVGKEYLDSYEWSDTLKFSKTNSGVYNLDSVKDIAGDDLTAEDTKYYNYLYIDKELNIIDIMNSDSNIFKNYEYYAKSSNIGTDKQRLDISYNVLKKDISDLAESYPLSGLMYGNSLNIIEGLNLGAVVAAGSENDGLLSLALSYEGNNLSDMMAIDNMNIFWKDHWCAMFVSFCMRKLEKDTGIVIPIPNYFACTSGCWGKYHEKPGFYDVQEWVDANPSVTNKNTNPANIAPLASIQPGDIILFSWVGDSTPGNRDHTAIVKSVEKDASGNVTKIETIDGNWGGSTFNSSKVKTVAHTGFNTNYWDLRSIASFISVSTVMAEYEKGNTW